MGRTIILLLSLVIAACSAEPAPPDTAETSQGMEQVEPAPADASAIAPLTIDEVESPIRLTPLTAADQAAVSLEGELGCGFAAGQGTLLTAMGNIGDREGRAQGLVKIGDSIERLNARQTGGYDGLPEGAEFETRGLTVTVTRTSDLPVSGGESPAYPAKLVLQRAAASKWVISGLWTCGP